MARITKVGVLTSGGDAPGMNAAVRAVVRTCLYHNIEVVGIRRGYEGMLNNDFIPLGSVDVRNIISRGGTLLGTARCEDFRKPEARKRAFSNIKKAGIDPLSSEAFEITMKKMNKVMDQIEEIVSKGK